MDKSVLHPTVDENKLYDDVSHLIVLTQKRTLREISRTGVMLYWHIGHRLNHDILKCARAEYGAEVIKNLADKLQNKFGRGFGHRIIHRCSQFITEIPSKEVFEERLHDAIRRAREIEIAKSFDNMS